MGLWDRIAGDPDEDKISVHHFSAALAEYGRGIGNKAQLVSAFNLNTGEADSLQLLLDQIDLKTADEKEAYRAKTHDVMLLSEGNFYTKAQAQTQLGV